MGRGCEGGFQVGPVSALRVLAETDMMAERLLGKTETWDPGQFWHQTLDVKSCWVIPIHGKEERKIF